MFVRINVSVLVDNSGPPLECPALLTPSGILEPLVDYFELKLRSRSLAWASQVTFAVRLFLEYQLANPQETNPATLFQNFALRLGSGTFDLDSQLDGSGLGWRPRSDGDVADLLYAVSDFLDWRAETQPAAALFNPLVGGDSFDRRCQEAAYAFRKSKAFLGHLWPLAAPDGSRRVQGRRKVKTQPVQPPRFPHNRFEELLDKGFRSSYRNQSITLLLHGAGLRVSEPFHLFFQDINLDAPDWSPPNIRIYHPADGRAPLDWVDATGSQRTGTRRAYLSERYGLRPRSELSDKRHAGWKGGLHFDDGLYIQTFFFEPEYYERFKYCWTRYLQQVASMDPAERAGHPFALLNTGKDNRGDMYRVDRYCDAHRRACERIGLVVRKDLGTTPHGHRHSLGDRLEKAEVSTLAIRQVLHHSSLESQEVYKGQTNGQIVKQLREANERTRASRAEGNAE